MLRGASGIEPPAAARAGEESESTFRVALPGPVGPEGGSRSPWPTTRRQHGAGKGPDSTEFDVGRGAEGSGSGGSWTHGDSDDRDGAATGGGFSASARRSAALGPKGRPDGPVLDYTVSKCFKLRA